MVTMPKLHSSELQVGVELLVDAHRTRWTHEHGRFHRIERGQRSFAWAVLDGTATSLPVGQVSRLYLGEGVR